MMMDKTRLCITLSLVANLCGCGNAPDAGYPGYIEGEYLYLAAPQAGYLKTLDAPRGSRVAAQAPLFAVDADPELHGLAESEARQTAAREKLRNLALPRRQSEVAAMAAQLHAAETALALSTQQLRQQEALAAKGFIAASRLDEARAARTRDAAQLEAARQQLGTYQASLGREPELRSAEAEVDALKAQVAQKRWQLDRKVVMAPSAGEISETYYHPGEWVPAGAAVLSLLPDTQRRLRFFVPETVVAGIAPGRKIEARCDGCADVIHATVDFVAPQSEYTPPVIYSRGSREKLVFRVEAVPAAAQAATLRPGLPLDVRVLER